MSYNYADSATISAGASDLKLASDSYVSYTPDYQTLVMSGNGSDMGVVYTNITVDSGGHAQFANRACVSAMTISSGGSADFATTWCMVKDLTVKDGGKIKFTNGKLRGSNFDIAVGGIDGCAAAYASGDTFYDYDNSLNIDLWDGVKFERATIRGTVSATANTAVSSSIVSGLLALRASSFAADITVNGGTVRIDQGATLRNATFNGGYISSLESCGLLKGTITGGTVTGGVISATAGAKISSTTVTGGTLQAIYTADSATFDSTTVNGGSLIVRAAGNLATNLSVANGVAYIQNGASASAATVTGGQFIVHNDSYASAADITVNGGKLRVQDGALATDVKLSAGNVSANTGGRVVGATITGGTLSAATSAVIENATVNGGTLQAPDANGNVTFRNITVANGTMIMNSATNQVNDLKAYGGYAYIQTGASGSKIEVASSGVLFIVGGTATEIIANGGSGRVQGAGASATGVTVNAGGDLSACISGKITDATVNGGQLCAVTTGTIESAVVNGGALNAIQANGSALIDSATVAGSNGMVVVRSATNRATNLKVEAGEAYIQSGASADNMTVTGGTLYALYDGTSATNAKVTGGLYRVDFNGKASGAWQNGGTVSVGTGAELTDLVVSGGSVVVNSGTLRELVVEGANVNVSTYNHALVESAIIRGGRFDAAQANGGVTFSSTTVDGGVMVVRHSNNLAVSTTLLSGTVHVQSSATASKMTVVSGTVSATDGAKIEDIALSGGVIYARNSKVWLDSTTVYGGTMQVDYATNSVTNLKVSGGVAYLQSGASGANIEVAGSGIFFMVGGTATGITANGGSARVQGAGALASGVTVNAGGNLSACISGRIVGATVNGGDLYAITTATIESAVVNGGYLQAAQANGSALLDSATAAGGTVIVRSATNLATNLTVSDGEAYIQAGASASDTTVTGGVFYALDDGTVVENTVVSAGSMRVQAYGTASGTVLSGGTLTTRSATFIDLEIQSGASAQFLNDVTFSGNINIGSGAAIYMGGDTVAPLTNVYTESGAIHNLAIGVNSVLLSGLVASNFGVSSAGRIITYDTTIYDLDIDARGTTANGQIYMSSGTVVSRGTVNGRYGANAVYMMDGAKFASATVENGNIFITTGGGSLTDLVQHSGQVVLRGSEAYVSGAAIDGGQLHIQNGAVAEDVTVLSGGLLVTSDTTYNNPAGSAETLRNINVLGGTMEIGSGATVTDLTVSGGTLYLSATAPTISGASIADAEVFVNYASGGGLAALFDSLDDVAGTLALKGVDTGSSYLIGETAAASGTVTLDCGKYRQVIGDAVKAGEEYSNAFLGRNYDFSDGKTLITSDFTVGTQDVAAELSSTNATVLADGGLATKWTNNTDVSAIPAAVAGANTTGDAWLTVDGANLATALYGAEGNFAHDVNLWIYEGTVRNLAAGAKAGGSVENVKLIISDNNAGTDNLAFTGVAYLGGFGTVNGEVAAAVYGGTFQKDFYAGALANKNTTNTTVGEVNLTVAGGKFNGNIYGASAVKTVDGTGSGVRNATGDVTLTVTGGESTKGPQSCIFAGGYATGAATGTVYTVASVTAEIAGGSWGTACGGRGVFGGILASGVDAEVTGNVNLTISGGSMGNVYGGGWAQKGGASTVGNVNITITGDAEIANVFGGGSHSTSEGSGGTTSAGDVTITVAGGTITGAIYARGQLDGDSVTGAEVIFKGSNGYACDIYGYTATTGQEPSNATLSFDGYTGTLSGSIGGFAAIALDGGTAMTIDPGEGESVSNAAWTFDVAERAAAQADVALLNWTTADFSGESGVITLNLATGDTNEWSLVDAAADTKYGKFDVQIDGVSILDAPIGLGDQIADGDHAGWGFTLEDTVLKFKNLA